MTYPSDNNLLADHPPYESPEGGLISITYSNIVPKKNEPTNDGTVFIKSQVLIGKSQTVSRIWLVYNYNVNIGYYHYDKTL